MILNKTIIASVLLVSSSFSQASDNNPCAEGSPYYDEPMCDQKIEEILEEDRNDPRIQEPDREFIEDIDRVGFLYTPPRLG